MTVFGKKYLRNPQQLQNLEEGEAWGPHALAVDFVGGPYLIQGLNEKQWKLLQEHFSESVRDPDTLDSKPTVLQIYKADANDFIESTRHPRIIDFDFDYHEHHVKVAGYRVISEITLTPATYCQLWTSESGKLFPAIIVENIFRIVLSYQLIRHGGMLVHSAAIVDNGEAYLFPGHSGAGKSTFSRLSLSEGLEVLSDDMNALTWQGDTAILEKVPFTGDLGHTWTRSSSYPLSGIFGLNKQDDITISSMSASEGFSLLVSSIPFLIQDPFRIPSLMESLYKLIKSAQPRKLGFKIDQPAWPTIRHHLSTQ